MLKRTIFAAAASALAVGSMLAACSSASTPPAPIAQVDLPIEAAHALCDTIQPCCAQVGYAYDDATCVANEQAALQAELTQESGQGGTYDANAAGNCVAQLRAAAATCADPPAGTTTASSCGAIFVGTKKVGDACTHSAECASSPDGTVSCATTTMFNGTGSTTSGLCVLYKTTAVKGDPCGGFASGMPASIQANCESDNSPLYCDVTTRTCLDRVAVGQPCKTDECAVGAYCKAGVCATDAALGEACTFANCGSGLYCDMPSPLSGSGTCAAQKKAGDACTGNGSNTCASGQCSMGKCSAGSLATADAFKGNVGSSSSSTDDGGTGDGGTSTLPDGG